jgi:hypothetical protein
MAMESNTPPSITSFVIRFVIDKSSRADNEAQPCYRGAIRHIQTDEELNFNTWKDAVAFIQRYVVLETESGQDDA